VERRVRTILNAMDSTVRDFFLLGGYVVAGIVLGGILFYLTPLNHIKLIEQKPRTISPQEFYDNLQRDPDNYFFIDIRSKEFRALEYPEGSFSVPLNTIVAEMDAIPRNKSIVVFCESNFSASAAYHVLQNNGFLDLSIVNGGRTAWKEAGLPLVEGAQEQIKAALGVSQARAILNDLPIP